MTAAVEGGEPAGLVHAADRGAFGEQLRRQLGVTAGAEDGAPELAEHDHALVGAGIVERHLAGQGAPEARA